jgi:glycosyltransferase involved in cell wall biosynthesis
MSAGPPSPNDPLRPGDATGSPVISVVICTCNRADLLPAAIDQVLAQDDPDTPEFELIVVDNNSTDATPAVVQRACAGDGRVRYLHESKQGVSHARNAGLLAARAAIIAYTDDDVRVSRTWLASIVRAFREYPDAWAVGGKVLPIWPSQPPPWLTSAHWGPLALADHGDQPLRLDTNNQLCLLGCNLAVLRSAFSRVGKFSANVQRVPGTVASSEDHEFLLRVFGAGAFAVYDPRIIIHAAVQPERLDRAYHRVWHRSQGHYNAMMRPEYLERSNAGRLFDVPLHLYRTALEDALRWIAATIRRDHAEAFARELRLRFFWGFLRTRYRQFRSAHGTDRLIHWRRRALSLSGQGTQSSKSATGAGRPS